MDPIIEQKLHSFSQRALSTLTTVHNSYSLAEECIKNGIAGDFVECGVFAGTQSAALALANQIHDGTRRTHLFDSFCGIPEAGPMDDETITSCVGKGQGRLISTGVDICPAKDVQNHMKEWGIDLSKLVFYEGWFQDTVPAAVNEGKIKKIAVLRLDGDLYESTKVCLEHLHPLVQKGGYVIVDDYALTGCRKAVLEYWQRIGRNFEVISVPQGGGPVYYKV